MHQHHNDDRRIIHKKQWETKTAGFHTLDAKAPEGYRVVSAGFSGNTGADVTVRGSYPSYDCNEGQVNGWVFQVSLASSMTVAIDLICEKSCAADRRTQEDLY